MLYFYHSCPGQKNRWRPVPVPMTGVRYNSLLWMCTLNTLTWPDLTWLLQRNNTALHHAAMKGHAEIMDMLLKAGSDVNAQEKVRYHGDKYNCACRCELSIKDMLNVWKINIALLLINVFGWKMKVCGCVHMYMRHKFSSHIEFEEWDVALWSNGSLDQFFMVDPLSYFLFQPVSNYGV